MTVFSTKMLLSLYRTEKVWKTFLPSAEFIDIFMSKMTLIYSLIKDIAL